MSDTPRDADLAYLQQAGTLAEKGRGFTHPNPVVGCLIVADGRVVGQGYHARYGEAHAEVAALVSAGDRARGATAYVTLEPCDHQGQTGPCTQALRDAGVKRVVFGASDPGPGAGGAERLREWGIDVEGPVFPLVRARARNPAFFSVHGRSEPYLAVKLAMSLDGRIAEGPGLRTAVTGPEAGARVQRLRREFDGIMVGRRTVEADDPRLTIRDGLNVPRPPARIVLDSGLGMSTDARLFSDPAPVLVFCGPEAPAERRKALEAAGARVFRVPVGPGGLDLEAVQGRLWTEGVRAVLCEGGGQLAQSLLAADLVQRLYLFVAPKLLGPRGVPAFPEGPSPSAWVPSMALDAPRGWTPVLPAETFGSDVLATWDRTEEPRS